MLKHLILINIFALLAIINIVLLVAITIWILSHLSTKIMHFDNGTKINIRDKTVSAML